GISPGTRAPKLREVAETWLEELDERPGERGRLERIESELAHYELVTIPIRLATRGSTPPRDEPFGLLRRKDLGQRPSLSIAFEGREFRVLMAQRSNLQIADLRIEAIDSRERIWSFRPTGDLAPGRAALARPDVLAYNSGTRPIELFRGTLP